jgi:hypothetical protein
MYIFICIQVGTYAGLPDGIFLEQKCQYWHSLEGLGMEQFGVLHGHFVFLLLFCL